jgi:hypothetical protein
VILATTPQPDRSNSAERKPDMPRKNITREDSYKGLSILGNPKDGCYIDILEAIRVRMENMVTRHCKVFGGLLTLNLPSGSGSVPDSDYVIGFAKALSRYLEGCSIEYHYVWAREQPTKDGQPHWHVLLLLDGNRTQSFYSRHLHTVGRLWAESLRIERGDGFAHLSTWVESSDPDYPYVRNGGVMIVRSSPDFQAAYGVLFKRASYLAKVDTKKFTPRGLRKYSPSHLS